MCTEPESNVFATLAQMSNPLTEIELKSLLASTAKRQNFLAGVHPFMHALPLLALAMAEGIDRNFGGRLTQRLLGTTDGKHLLDSGDAPIELPAPVTTLEGGDPSIICRSCWTCSGFAFVSPKGLYGVGVYQAVKSQAVPTSDQNYDSGLSGPHGEAMRSW